MKWVVNIKKCLLSSCSKRESEIFKKCVKDQKYLHENDRQDNTKHYVHNPAIHLQKQLFKHSLLYRYLQLSEWLFLTSRSSVLSKKQLTLNWGHQGFT